MKISNESKDVHMYCIQSILLLLLSSLHAALPIPQPSRVTRSSLPSVTVRCPFSVQFALFCSIFKIQISTRKSCFVFFSFFFFFLSSFVSPFCVCAWNYCNFGRQVCVVFVCPSFPACLQSVELSSFMHSLFQLPSSGRADQPERNIACSGDTCLISSFRLWPHILRAGAVEVEGEVEVSAVRPSGQCLIMRPLPDFYRSSFSKAALAFLWNVLGARWTSSRTRRTKDDEKKYETKRSEKQTESSSLRMLEAQQ